MLASVALDLSLTHTPNQQIDFVDINIKIWQIQGLCDAGLVNLCTSMIVAPLKAINGHSICVEAGCKSL